MPLNFKKPSEVANEYLQTLKGLKPSLNVDQQDSDWWIRGQVVGGVLSGVYADQLLISNDAFPQKARHDALGRALELYFGNVPGQGDFLPATQALGNVAVTGDSGMTIPNNLQFLYAPNGNTYQSTEAVVLDGPTGLIPVKSVSSGQSQNVLGGAVLTVSSPPAGMTAIAVADENGIVGARDGESDTEARVRLLARIQQPLSVGRISDYVQYAKQADPSVTSASLVAYPFGLGTVAVYITAGTTNIDDAIDQNQAISIQPSQALIDIVQDYLNINRPTTDCVTVLGPEPIPIDVQVRVRYAQGNGSTILSGQTLTQEQLVIREVKRALYKTPVGGRLFGSPASGFVVAAEIEQTIDAKLSAMPVLTGEIGVLLDRQVSNLAVSGADRMILASEAPIPGNITVVLF